MGNSFSHHLLIHLHSCINTLNDAEATKQIIFNIWLNHHCNICTPRNLKLMISLLCSIAKTILIFFPTHQETRCCLSVLGLYRSSQMSFGTYRRYTIKGTHTLYTYCTDSICIHLILLFVWWWYNSILLILPIFLKFAFFHSHSFDLFGDDTV